MFGGILLLFVILLGIVSGVVYNILFIKDYPDYKRKIGYFITILVFLIFIFSIYSIISIKSYLNSVIKEYSIRLEQHLKDNYPENEFVKNGLDLKQINNDISQINNMVHELKSILPTYKELGVEKIVYDLIINYAVKELQKRLGIVNYSAKIITSFADKDNILTVPSIIHELRLNAIKLINLISVIVLTVFIIAFLVYIIYTLTVVMRERKFKKV
jgi:hypothetical protein